MVLNNDGTPNPLPVVDPYGNKRGPKNASKAGVSADTAAFPGTARAEHPGLFPSLPPNFPPGFPHNFPFMAQMQLQQLQSQLGSHPKVAQVPPFRPKEEERGVSPPTMEEAEQMRCDKCEFSTSSTEVYKNHQLLHASSERGALHRLLTSPMAKEGGKEEAGLSFSRSPSSPRFPARPLFTERPESPPGPAQTGAFPNPSLEYFNKIAIANPLLQGLVPNPAIRALMEQRKQTGASLPSSPESFRQDSPQSRETDSAPLPPNKRIKTDIFASLYATKMSEMAEKGESPAGVLDLSKECNTDTVIGGGSHGSSSDNESGSNPRSHSSSPSLTSSGTKNRRKGKAYKIERRFDIDRSSEEEISEMPGLMPVSRPTETFSELNTCKFCGISFKNSAMHTVHMGYHGCREPFKCNLCGDQCEDALSFFLHIARKEHL